MIAQNQRLSKKVEIERENKTSVGDINSFAYVKSGAKSATAVAPAPQAVAAAPVRETVKPEINSKYDWY